MEMEALHEQIIFRRKIVEKTTVVGRAEVVRPQTVQPEGGLSCPSLIIVESS